MDVAALIISIFAVLLSLIVAGFAIGLQWLMYNATTRQLSLIGKESASLAERIAKSLGELHETATSTRSRLDATLDQLVSGLLGRPTPPGEEDGGEKQATQGDWGAWRVERAVKTLGPFAAAPALLQYLSAAPRHVGTLRGDLLNLMPDGGNKEIWRADVLAVLAALMALGFLLQGPEEGTVSLAPAARQIAPRLAEAKSD